MCRLRAGSLGASMASGLVGWDRCPLIPHRTARPLPRNAAASASVCAFAPSPNCAAGAARSQSLGLRFDCGKRKTLSIHFGEGCALHAKRGSIVEYQLCQHHLLLQGIAVAQAARAKCCTATFRGGFLQTLYWETAETPLRPKTKQQVPTIWAHRLST